MCYFSFRKLILLVSLLFLFISNAFAQTAGKDFEFYFQSDTIHVTQGKTFNNFLIVKNNTNQEVNIGSLIAEEKYPGLILSPKNPSTIPAGGEQKLFVKFIASSEFMKIKSDAISFILTYTNESGKQKSEKATFFRKRNQVEEILIYPFSQENFIDPSIPESNLSFFIENTGYASRSIQIEFESTFAGLMLTPKQITINLEGKEKQLIELKLSIRQQKTYYPDYNIQVKAIDLISNKEVNNRNIKINVLSKNTQIMQSSYFSTDKNYMEVAYNQLGNGYDYMQFKANTKFNINKDTYATFNTATDYYLNQEAFSMHDTYLDLERKGSSVRLGNIYGNEYDYSISGRGIKAIGDLGSNKKIEVLAVDNNYNLYSNYITESKGSKTIAAKYSFGTFDTFNGKVSYLYDHDPLMSTNSNVCHYTSAFKLKRNHSFKVEAGVSHEKSMITSKENIGAATSLNYDYRINRLEVSSLNTFASKNYAGMNRGNFNLHQNIGYRFIDNKRLFLQYQNSQSQPGYLQHQYNDSNTNIPFFNSYSFYSTHAVKTGFQFSKPKWNFLLSPEIEKQKNNSNFIKEALLSYRFRATVGTFIKAHNLDLSVEYSYSEASEAMYKFSSFKSMLTYRYKGFSLNSTAQFNPYNINDLNYFSEDSKEFINFNVYSSYNFTALKKTLIGSFSGGINYSELYKNMNQNFNANLEYKITPSWASTAYVNYSNYESLLANSFKGHNYQFRIGIKKYFQSLESGGYHRVNLQFYNDQNLNGILDENESVLPNQIIKLDNYVAKTDKNGKVSFRNVPKGTYKLRVNESTGLRLMDDTPILVEKNQNSKIALGKNNKVKGKLVELRQTYDLQSSDIRGIVVYAEDENGIKTYTAVDPNDEFEFFLKNGTYRIFIENQNFEYLEPSQTIKLNNADYSEILIFEYRKKDRQIKVKKF